MSAGSELILGGQRSGKSRCAEQRAAAWLARPGHTAVLIATAVAHDGEMHERIARHRADRAVRVPGLLTEEVPLDLPQAVRRLSASQHLIVIDCLTLWLTNLLMPMSGSPITDTAWQPLLAHLCDAVDQAPGPVTLVSNEIGLGVSPLSAEARHFIDELGRLHQAMASRCERVTWMVAGIEMPVKKAST